MPWRRRRGFRGFPLTSGRCIYILRIWQRLSLGCFVKNVKELTISKAQIKWAIKELIDVLEEVLIRNLESGEDGSEAILFAIDKLGLPYSKEMRDSDSYYDCSYIAFYSWHEQGMNLTYESTNTVAQEAEWIYRLKSALFSVF